MRVLWFAPTSSQFDKDSHYYHGGGWIESLEQVFRDHQPEVKLAISFLHDKNDQTKERGNVTYYPVKRIKRSNINKLINNWSCKIESGVYIKKFLEVINNFQPDVIQVFGTENSFAEIQQHTKVPVVIHLQGIVNQCNNAFYPPGISRYNLLTYFPFFKNHLLGNSLLFDKKRFENQAKRELEFFKASKYLTGRTHWDKMLSSMLAPQAMYFHIDEILRPSFYKAMPWVPNQHNRLQIISTLSSTIYKGLDIILNTAFLLKTTLGVDFEWHIVGLDEHDKLVRFFEHTLKKKFKECNVSFLGVKSEHELIKLLQAANIFIHPSYIDNSPNSLCEAQMLGMPVMSFDIGGISTLIENNKTGILVGVNGAFELALSIISLTRDKKKSAQLGYQARVSAMERHNRARIFNALMNVYQTLHLPTSYTHNYENVVERRQNEIINR